MEETEGSCPEWSSSALVWHVRVTAKDEAALNWLKANEFPLRKLFRERHRAGQEDREEEHPHSLFVGPEWNPMALRIFDDMPHEKSPFGAGARAATRLHCEQTITDIAEAIRMLGGTPADFEIRCLEDTGERIVA